MIKIIDGIDENGKPKKFRLEIPMKYIRTENGIFEEEYVHIKVDKDGYAIMEYKGNFYEAPEKVKQADTIEELCDEFVFVYKDKPNINHKFKEHLISIENNNVYFVDSMVIRSIDDSLLIGTIYGAIWTDKGLIYVARMNEKGELELI